MPEMHRFSSRRQRLDRSFLANRLRDAKSYKRIAGYFRTRTATADSTAC